MDTGPSLIDHLAYTIEDAYRDLGYSLCLDVRALLKPLHDRALLDDDSEESLLFNGVYIACDEYRYCSPLVKKEYATRVRAAVLRCVEHQG